MINEAQQKAQAFRDELLEKIERTVKEYADGQLNREQFQQIYARYTERLTIANMALMSGETSSVDAVQSDGSSTVALRSSLQGKALGLMVYHNKSGTIVETLGNPDVSVALIGPLLNDLADQIFGGRAVEPVIRHVGEKQWLVLLAGRLTITVTQFRREPAPAQIRELRRLHQDFETADVHALQKGIPTADQLAYPFMAFVEKAIR
ncbi:MAG: hypothetical protein ACOCYT_03265 [Chloroflexota bacterium]